MLSGRTYILIEMVVIIFLLLVSNRSSAKSDRSLTSCWPFKKELLRRTCDSLHKNEAKERENPVLLVGKIVMITSLA